MSISRPGAFRSAMEATRATIALQLAEETHAAGLVPPDIPMPHLLAGVNTNLGLWLDAIEGHGLSELEQATASWCTVVRSRGGDVPTALRMIERTGELLLDAALVALDQGIDGADDGVRGVLRAWTTTKGAYDRTIRAAYEAAAERALILHDVAEKAPIGVGITTTAGDFTYMNPAHRKMLGLEAEDVLGKNIRDILVPEEAQMLPYAQQPGPQSSRAGILRLARRDGSTLRAHTTTFWVFTDQGAPIARCAFVRDMTEEEQAEEERQALERQIVETQEAALRELGTPVLPISERVLAMPIVGMIDPARASRIIEEMLSGIVRTGAGHVLVDITGVPRVTAEVGEMILRAAKAAELVGTEMVLTGVRGNVAKTLLELGISFAGVETQSTMRAGVAHAIEHEREKMRAERPRR